MKRILNTALTTEQITVLESAGFKRWTKAGKDRLYANGKVAKTFGLEVDYYNSGSIRYAELDGDKISNAEAGRILTSVDGAYIDVLTSKLHASDRAMKFLKAGILELPESAE